MDFNKLKANRGAAIDKLVNAAEASSKPAQTKSFTDDRIWKPTRDKSGNGYAVIRFLPEPEGELPWAKYWSHGFKGETGQWYIEKSLTSIGQDDPVGEMNALLWNSGNEKDKQIARDRKRRLHYASNILVESDSANPQNEGKVFLYVYGAKIFAKIMDAMEPEFADETPMNPFDFWEGASFKIKIRKVEGFVNYDKSEFAAPAPLHEGDDARLEGVFDKLYALKEFTDPAEYKTYDELKAKLNRVLGASAAAPVMEAPVRNEPAAVDAGPVSNSVEADAGKTADADDDTMSYFQTLAQED